MADHWENWAGSVHCRPAELCRPTSEAEVAEAVRRAVSAGRCVRVAGSGHSFSPLVATDGTLLSLDELAGVRCDADRSEARIQAGTKLHAIGEPLLEQGLAMENLGDIDRQALAGALATGTHGTGVSLGNLPTQVTALRIVLASGETRVCDAGDPDLLAAARVSLGALGVVTEATLRVLPAYCLHERTRRISVADMHDEREAAIARHRHWEFWWYPSRDLCEVKTLDATDAAPDPLPDHKYERIDWSSRILPSERDLRFHEMEYSLPAETGPDCFDAVRARMQARHADVVWPVEYRNLAADDAWLSTAHGRATVTLSLHQDIRLPYRDFFDDIEPIFLEAGGRPHWGKIHNLSADSLRTLYPRFDDFLALREALDPHHTFTNPHLDRLFG